MTARQLPALSAWLPTCLAACLAASLMVACDSLDDDAPADPLEPTQQEPTEWEPDPQGARFSGVASYYADKFEGLPTASGEPYRADSLTCAHRTLPFGTHLRVTRGNLHVDVRVNDRGPNTKQEERVIDLSKAAAKAIDLIADGVAQVTVQQLRPKSATNDADDAPGQQ